MRLRDLYEEGVSISDGTQPEQRKAKNVKSTKTLLSLSAVLLALIFSKANAMGGELNGAKGGASLLANRTPVSVSNTATSSSEKLIITQVSCGGCRDSLKAVKDPTTKGATVLVSSATKSVAVHECGTCKTKFETTGHGRAKVTTPVHLCGSCR